VPLAREPATEESPSINEGDSSPLEKRQRIRMTPSERLRNEKAQSFLRFFDSGERETELSPIIHVSTEKGGIHRKRYRER
jgi:hypothetical protein